VVHDAADVQECCGAISDFLQISLIQRKRFDGEACRGAAARVVFPSRGFFALLSRSLAYSAGGYMTSLHVSRDAIEVSKTVLESSLLTLIASVSIITALTLIWAWFFT
jgi:hypothetical protein